MTERRTHEIDVEPYRLVRIRLASVQYAGAPIPQPATNPELTFDVNGTRVSARLGDTLELRVR